MGRGQQGPADCCRHTRLVCISIRGTQKRRSGVWQFAMGTIDAFSFIATLSTCRRWGGPSPVVRGGRGVARRVGVAAACLFPAPECAPLRLILMAGILIHSCRARERAVHTGLLRPKPRGSGVQTPGAPHTLFHNAFPRAPPTGRPRRSRPSHPPITYCLALTSQGVLGWGTLGREPCAIMLIN